MTDYKATSEDLTAVANAIRQRGGTSAPLTFPDGFVSAIQNIPGGGIAEAPYKPIEFIDYDGFRLYSYTKEEFLALSEMPPNPTHSGLTAQGWNWSLNGAQSYVRKYGVNVIGQCYVTDDGKDRLYLRIDYPSTEISIYINAGSSVSYTIDWGDGSAAETFSGNVSPATHTYSAIGSYLMTVESTGTITFSGSNNQRSFLTPNGILNKIEMGANSDWNYAIYRQGALTEVTTRKTYSSGKSKIQDGCPLLRAFVCGASGVPNYSFVNGGIKRVSLPELTSNANYTASFNGSTNIERIIIPENVVRIDSNGPRYCDFVKCVVVPDTVNYMYANAFNGLTSCKEYHFHSTTPPTRSGSAAFASMPADCIIYVPYSEDHSILEAYQTNTNWASMASYMQEEPQ